MPRRALLALAIVAGVLSGALYVMSTQRVGIVVAARDVDPPRPLVGVDLELRTVPADLVPDGAFAAVDEAIGLTPLVPLLRGQLVLGRAVVTESHRLASGLAIPPGFRAIAIPVNAADAAGGTVRAGSSVDVVTVPIPGRAPPERTTELLAVAALVLDVRSENGARFTAPEQQAGPLTERIGSVVLAVSSADALWLADRVTTSTFVITLRTP